MEGFLMKNKVENNVTELVFILDRSGSMSGLERDTIGGFNAMIEKQKKQDGLCLVSTVLFANDSAVIHDRVRLDQIEPMTDRDYTVGGCTAGTLSGGVWERESNAAPMRTAAAAAMAAYRRMGLCPPVPRRMRANAPLRWR
jgi:hypothetical protein